MRGAILRGRLARFLLFVTLLVFDHTRAEAAGLTLANKSAELKFDARTGVVTHWRLPGIMQETSAREHVPVDLAAPGRRLFHLGGQIHGRTVSEWERLAGGWQVTEQTDSQVTMVLAHPELPVVLRKKLSLPTEPWRVSFLFEVVPLGDPVDVSGLILTWGPGVGESPAAGMGVAAGAYSFTEIVYLQGSRVETHRFTPDEPRRFAPAEGTSQWQGLQSRYFGLLLAPVTGGAATAKWYASAPGVGEVHSAGGSFETSLHIVPSVVRGTNRGGTNPGTLQMGWMVFGGPKTIAALSPHILGNAGEVDLRALLFGDQWVGMEALTLGIMHLLAWIQKAVANWGIAILVLALLVRLALFPITKKLMRAQAKLALLQDKIRPEMREIRRDYKGGDQSERILALYKKHGISPLAGLKPLLIVAVQLPLFIAMYHLLGRYFPLRDASFLWMDSLGRPDRLFALGVDLPFFGAYFNLLPVLMAIATLVSIHFSATPTTDAKASIGSKIGLGAMTLGFFLLFYNFPSGMVLYWTAANLLHLLHAMWMKRRLIASQDQVGILA